MRPTGTDSVSSDQVHPHVPKHMLALQRIDWNGRQLLWGLRSTALRIPTTARRGVPLPKVQDVSRLNPERARYLSGRFESRPRFAGILTAPTRGRCSGRIWRYGSRLWSRRQNRVQKRRLRPASRMGQRQAAPGGAPGVAARVYPVSSLHCRGVPTEGSGGIRRRRRRVTEFSMGSRAGRTGPTVRAIDDSRSDAFTIQSRLFHSRS